MEKIQPSFPQLVCLNLPHFLQCNIIHVQLDVFINHKGFLKGRAVSRTKMNMNLFCNNCIF